MTKLMSKLMSHIFRLGRQRLEQASLSLDEPSPTPECFARWLQSHEDIDSQTIPRQRLLALYAEFCEYYDLTPLPPGRFDRLLKSAGFQRRRLSTLGRRWVYQLKGSDVACSSIGSKGNSANDP
jgi:hypothetical protein